MFFFVFVEASTRYPCTRHNHLGSVAKQRSKVCLPTGQKRGPPREEPRPKPKPNPKTNSGNPYGSNPSDQRTSGIRIRLSPKKKKWEERGGATAATQGPAEQ